MPYKVIGKAHHRGNEMFTVGANIEPTPEELKAFPDRFVEVSARRGRPPKSESSDEVADVEGNADGASGVVT